jgi:hypothetical protein
VSGYLKTHLPARLEAVVPDTLEDERVLAVAIKKAAVEAQAAVVEEIDCMLSGSTCVMAFMVKGSEGRAAPRPAACPLRLNKTPRAVAGGWNAVVANIGDSRAVLAVGDPERPPPADGDESVKGVHPLPRPRPRSPRPRRRRDALCATPARARFGSAA